MEIVKIACKGSASIDLAKFKVLQGKLKGLSEENYQRLRKEILTTGFAFAPHVWQDPAKRWWLVDGTQRVTALLKMQEEGIKIPKIPIVTVQAKNLKEAKRRVLQGVSQYGKITQSGLKEFLIDSKFTIEDIEASFDFPDIDLPEFVTEHFREAEEYDESEDIVPEVPKHTIVKLGDLWTLGNHRLMCGDSVDSDSVSDLVGNEKMDMVFTDPPYNANYSSRVDKKRRKPWGGILNDNMTVEAFDSFLLDINSIIFPLLHDGAAVYECIDWKRYPQMQKVFGEAFQHKAMIVWNKNYFGLGTYYRTKHELILFGIKGDSVKTWNGDHNEMDVWDINRESNNNYVHPTQKPVQIVERALKNSSNAEDNILDLFGGSGTTLIAAEKIKRKCFMMELDPYYCQVILQRWAEYTGEDPVRRDGKKLSQLLKNTKIKKSSLQNKTVEQ